MATRYGIVSKRISSEDVYSADVANMTITSQGNDQRGGYYITAYINEDAPGCGNPKFPIMTIKIKNQALLGWKRVVFKTYGTFKSSCWYLNEATYANNIQTFSTAAGDKIFKSENCFELPQFTTQTAVCDNNTTNAFHTTYASGTYRIWYQSRRRNSLTVEAGPSIELGCNLVGSTNIITMSDIYVMI